MKNYRLSSSAVSSTERGTVHKHHIEFLKCTAFAALVAVGFFTFTASKSEAQQYWDGTPGGPGTIDGGSGNWRVGGPSNWTDAAGAANSVYDATPTTVTVFGQSGNAGASATTVGGTVTVNDVGGTVVLTNDVNFTSTSDNTISRFRAMIYKSVPTARHSTLSMSPEPEAVTV